MLQNSEIYLLIPNRPSIFVQSGAKSVLPESLPILERSLNNFRYNLSTTPEQTCKGCPAKLTHKILSPLIPTDR
jgi:hypothetical protein